jgi:Ca2+-binding RTX toxin-like protein
MVGGTGDDDYVVDSVLDMVTELAGGGTDRVSSSITRTLGVNQENLTLIGAASINGTGNALANTINGNSGTNTLMGGAGNDIINGGDGNDVIHANQDNDTVTGGLGNDVLGGGLGNDNLDGGDGDDTFMELFAGGTAGNDVFVGGAGIDMVNYNNSLDGVNVSLLLAGAQLVSAGSGSDTLTGIENLVGSNFNDVLNGDAGNNSLSGLAGNDIIRGGLGNDTLTGGAGADRFVLNTAPGAGNVDTMTDFVSGQDVIALSATVFTAFAGQVGNTVGLSDNLTYNAGTGVLAYDADGAGAGAAVDVAVIGSPTHPATLGNDFLIVA